MVSVRQKRNINRYLVVGSRAAEVFTITPKTFILPNDYGAFCEEFSKVYCSHTHTHTHTLKCQLIALFAQNRELASNRNYWIMKPVGMSRGRGIELVTDIAGKPALVLFDFVSSCFDCSV